MNQHVQPDHHRQHVDRRRRPEHDRRPGAAHRTRVPQEVYDRAQRAGALNAPDNRSGRRKRAVFLRNELPRKKSAQLRNRCRGATMARGATYTQNPTA